MLRLFAYIFLAVFLLPACTKSRQDNPSLYGTWVNKNLPGDTLWFIAKNGKDILRFNNSFNPNMPHYEEYEYSYKEGKLSIMRWDSPSFSSNVDSFTWQQPNREFDLLGYQLYPFMSSSSTHFTYVKL